MCSKGEGLGEEYFAYAISEDYSENITIGSYFKGYDMKKKLPNSFSEFDYTSLTSIEIYDDEIIVYKNNKIV